MLSSENLIAENELFLQKYGADLQANIFTSRRKAHVLMLFLDLKEVYNQGEVIQLLSSLANNSEEKKGLYLTSYQNQMDFKTRMERDSSLFLNLFLTSEGLKKLGPIGVGWDAIRNHLENNAEDLKPDKNNRWKNFYNQAYSIDAVLLLAHQERDALIRVKRQLEEDYFGRINIACVYEESGQIYRQSTNDNRQGQAVEHFGYADGIGNPCITRRDFQKFRHKNATKKNWNPFVSYENFVIEEPRREEALSFGSYLVFRKIKQDLNKFQAAVNVLAEKLEKTDEKAEVGALAIGRRRDGSSLEIEPERVDRKNLNDFYYSGQRCPLFAHTRKVNPRDNPAEELPKSYHGLKPMIRRGITYGKRAMAYGQFATIGQDDYGDEMKTPEELGILFMSYQNDIDNYQEILRQGGQGELDPILGDLKNSGKKFIHKIPGLKEPYEGFGGFASLLGGLNLYAPSIRFFKELSRH